MSGGLRPRAVKGPLSARCRTRKHLTFPRTRRLAAQDTGLSSRGSRVRIPPSPPFIQGRSTVGRDAVNVENVGSNPTPGANLEALAWFSDNPLEEAIPESGHILRAEDHSRSWVNLPTSRLERCEFETKVFCGPRGGISDRNVQPLTPYERLRGPLQLGAALWQGSPRVFAERGAASALIFGRCAG